MLNKNLYHVYAHFYGPLVLEASLPHYFVQIAEKKLTAALSFGENTGSSRAKYFFSTESLFHPVFSFETFSFWLILTCSALLLSYVGVALLFLLVYCNLDYLGFLQSTFNMVTASQQPIIARKVNTTVR